MDKLVIDQEIQQEYIKLLKKILPKDKCWVVFSRGTYLVLEQVLEDFEQEALHFIRQKGRVIPGTPLADFNVENLPDETGWVINFYLQEMKTIVLQSEVLENEKAAVQVGLYGRYKRDLDAKEPEIIYKNIRLSN